MTSQVTYVSSVDDRCKRSKLNNVIQSLHCYISNSTPDVANQDFGLIDYCGPICKGQLIQGNQPAKKAGTPITAMGVYLGDINKDGVLRVTNTQSISWNQTTNTTITTSQGYCCYDWIFDPSGSGSSCYCVHDNGHDDTYTCERSCCICPGYCGACSVCYVCIKEVWTCHYTKNVMDCCVFTNIYRGSPTLECGAWLYDGSHEIEFYSPKYLGPGMSLSKWSYEGLDRAIYETDYYDLLGNPKEACIAAGKLEPIFSTVSKNTAKNIINGIGFYCLCVGPETMCAFANMTLDPQQPVVNEWLWCGGKLCYHQKCNFGLQWCYGRLFRDDDLGHVATTCSFNFLGSNMVRNVTYLDETRGPFLCDNCISEGRWQFRCSPDIVKENYNTTVNSWGISGGEDARKNVWGYNKFGDAATSAAFGTAYYPSNFGKFGDFSFYHSSMPIVNSTMSCLCASTTGNITLCLCSICYCTVVCTKITCICTCTWDFSCNICINERYF